MRRGLLRGLGRCSDADSRRAVGQRDDLLLGDDFLNLFQAVLVERQNRVADKLLLLQFTDDVAIVARRQFVFLGNFCRNRLHLALDFGERLVRHLSELRGRNVDAVVLHIERVVLGRQTEIVTRLGQHGRSAPTRRSRAVAA